MGNGAGPEYAGSCCVFFVVFFCSLKIFIPGCLDLKKKRRFYGLLNKIQINVIKNNFYLLFMVARTCK